MERQQLESVINKYLSPTLVLVMVAGSSFVIGNQFGNKSDNARSQQNPTSLSENESVSVVDQLQQTLSGNLQSNSASPTISTNEPQTATSGLISLNSATAAQLETLPGIGPAKAKAIVDYRIQNGPFIRIDDLVNVSGIGQKTLEKLRPYISL